MPKAPELVEDYRRGLQMAQSFEDEFRKISAGQSKAANILGLSVPAAGYGQGEEGALSYRTKVMLSQQALEHEAELTRSVGDPKSDRIQAVLGRLHGTAGDEETKVRIVQKANRKAASVDLRGLLAQRLQEKAAAPKDSGRRRAALVGVPAGAAAGAGLGALLRLIVKSRMPGLGGKVLPAAGAAGGGLGGLLGSLYATRKGQAKTAAVTSVGYTKYFKNKMHVRGITSPTQLSEEQKKEFFESVDAGWHSGREKFEKLKKKMPGG